MPRKPWYEGREPKFSTHVPSGYSIDYVEWERKDGTWRKYLIDGEPCVSVTEILGLIDDGKSGGMAYAAGRIWLKGVVDLLADPDFVEPDEVSIPAQLLIWEASLKSRKLLHTDVWGAKATTGTDVHTILEELCEGKVPSLSDVPPDQRGYARALCEFWADHDPNVLHSEILLGSREQKYAGRCDLVYEVNEATVMLDAKTSREVRPSYALQLRGYADAYLEAGYGAVNHMEVLWLKPDGYELVKCNATSEQWRAVVEAHRAFYAVKSELKEAA